MTYGFKEGQTVRVRSEDPPRHVRTPSYVRGRTGRIVKCHGAFADPEERAYFRDGLPPKHLYLIVFQSDELWGEKAARGGMDRIYIDLYEHWLEEAN